MALYVRPQNRQEKIFFARLYPKLDQIQTLKTEMNSADKDRQPFVKQRLENETLMLAKYLGPDHENRLVSHHRARQASLLQRSFLLYPEG